MPISTTPGDDKPRRGWSDYSFEAKAMFAYHVAMMALFITGALPVLDEVGIAAGLIAAIGTASLVRRWRIGWIGPALTGLDWLKTAGVLAVSGLFAFAVSPLARQDDPHIVPWFLMLGGIALFNALQQAKRVYFYEDDFRAAGIPANPSPPVDGEVAPVPGEPGLHRVVRAVYFAAMYAVMLTFMAFFYLHDTAIRDGSPRPTAALTAPLTEHGSTVYIAADRAALIALLLRISMIGIPVSIVLGFGLQIFGGVRLFPGGIWVFGKRVS